MRAGPLRTRRSGDGAGCGPGSFSVGGALTRPSPLSPQPALGCPRAAPARRGRNRAWGGPPHLRRGRAPGAPGGLRSGGWSRAWARGAPPCAGASASASAASAASASAAAAAAAAIHCGPGRPSRAPSERKPRRRRNPAGEERPRPRPRTAPGPAPEARPAERRERPFLPSPFSAFISRFLPSPLWVPASTLGLLESSTPDPYTSYFLDLGQVSLPFGTFVSCKTKTTMNSIYCARHCFRLFMGIISFKLHSNIFKSKS